MLADVRAMRCNVFIVLIEDVRLCALPMQKNLFRHAFVKFEMNSDKLRIRQPLKIHACNKLISTRPHSIKRMSSVTTDTVEQNILFISYSHCQYHFYLV